MSSAGFNIEAYEIAQEAVTLMKSAVLRLRIDHPEGLKTSNVGHKLGVYGDHLDGQPGWICDTVLRFMENEATVEHTGSVGLRTIRSDTGKPKSVTKRKS